MTAFARAFEAAATGQALPAEPAARAPDRPGICSRPWRRRRRWRAAPRPSPASQETGAAQARALGGRRGARRLPPLAGARALARPPPRRLLWGPRRPSAPAGRPGNRPWSRCHPNRQPQTPPVTERQSADRRSRRHRLAQPKIKKRAPGGGRRAARRARKQPPHLRQLRPSSASSSTYCDLETAIRTPQAAALAIVVVCSSAITARAAAEPNDAQAKRAPRACSAKEPPPTPRRLRRRAYKSTAACKFFQSEVVVQHRAGQPRSQTARRGGGSVRSLSARCGRRPARDAGGGAPLGGRAEDEAGPDPGELRGRWHRDHRGRQAGWQHTARGSVADDARPPPGRGPAHRVRPPD